MSEPTELTNDELDRLQDMAGQCAINARLTGVVEESTIACLQLVPHLIAEVRRLRSLQKKRALLEEDSNGNLVARFG